MMPARVLLVAQGSLGDMLPMLVIGKALAARGHRVRVKGPASLQDRVLACGLEFAPSGSGDPRQVLQQLEAEAPRGQAGRVARVLETVVRRPSLPTFQHVCGFAEDVHAADFVLVSYLENPVRHVAEAHGRPFAVFHPTPALPTRAYAHVVGPLWWHSLSKPGVLNLLSHVAWNTLVWRATRRWTRELREVHLQLPSQDEVFPQVPRLVAASRSLFPAPPDWPVCWQVTGALPAFDGAPEPSLSPELTTFLQAGSPPLFVGFSSSPVPETFWRQVVAPAIASIGCRAVIAAGWSRLPDGLSSRDVFVVDQVPYRALFPHVSAAIHACGIGTLTEAVRCGVPSVAVPVFGEQKFLAARARRLGLVPPPVLAGTLTATRLARLIAAVRHDPRYRERTAAMAARIRQEDGAGTAVRSIEALIDAAAATGSSGTRVTR